jgi:hypothetical protein
MSVTVGVLALLEAKPEKAAPGLLAKDPDIRQIDLLTVK